MIALSANIKRAFLYFLAFTMFLLIGISPVASALSAEQKRIFDSGIYYFDAQVSSSACSGSTSLVGSVNKEKAWNFFTATKGLSPIQAAGIMGNIQSESAGTWDPRVVQGNPPTFSDTITVDGKTGYGIAQWTSAGRQQGLLDFAKSKDPPESESDLGIQLDFLWHELETNYTTVLADLRSTNDLAEATYIILKGYEKPADIPGNKPVRLNYATLILAEFGSSSPTGAADTSAVISCDNTSPGELPPSGDAVTLCSQVSGFVKQGKVDFGHTNDKNNLDAGYVTRELGYGSAPEDQIGAKVPLDPQVCRMMIYLVNQGFTFRVSSMVGTHPWCTSKRCPSKHWTGSAVDIDTINGTNMGANPAGTVANVVKFMKTLGSMPLAGRPSQVLSQGVGGSGCAGEPGTYIKEIDDLSLDGQQPDPGFTSDKVGCHMDHVHVGY